MTRLLVSFKGGGSIILNLWGNYVSRYTLSVEQLGYPFNPFTDHVPRNPSFEFALFDK